MKIELNEKEIISKYSKKNNLFHKLRQIIMWQEKGLKKYWTKTRLKDGEEKEGQRRAIRNM